MKIKYSLLLLFILVILGSCHTSTDDFISKYCPGSCTVIKGRLTTDNRTKPLPGVKLNVYWQVVDPLGLSSNTRRKAVTTTDADGNFELRFLIRDDELEGARVRYFVEANAGSDAYLYCLGQNHLLEYAALERNTTITTDYNLPRKAQLQLQVRNPDAMATGDYIQTSFEFDAGEASAADNCVPGTYQTPANPQATTAVAANQDVILRIYKRKAGTTTTSEEVIRLAPGQVLQQQITF